MKAIRPGVHEARDAGPHFGYSHPAETSLASARARMYAQLDQSFTHLRMHGTSSAMATEFEMFLRAQGTLLTPALILRCRIVDGVLEHSVVVDNPRKHRGVFDQCMRFLERIRARVQANTEFMVLLSDTMYVAEAEIPRCVEFLKRVPFLRADWLEGDPLSSHSVVVPDFWLLDDGYEAELLHICSASAGVPFSDREEVIKWRGRLSGPGYPDAENCHRFPRYRLLKLAAARPEIVDARLTTYRNFPETAAGVALRTELENLLGPPVPEIPPWDFVFYKYLISIDGVVSSWKRVANSLWTGSTVLLQHRWSQFFYPGLVPWEHYVPLADDLSDLLDIYEWLRAHPSQAERIAYQGRLFAEQLLNVAEIENFFVTALNACASLPARI